MQTNLTRAGTMLILLLGIFCCSITNSASIPRILLQYHEFLRQIVKNHQVGEERGRSVFLELRDISVSATTYNTHSSIVTKIA